MSLQIGRYVTNVAEKRGRDPAFGGCIFGGKCKAETQQAVTQGQKKASRDLVNWPLVTGEMATRHRR